jgi:hypothetical protein
VLRDQRQAGAEWTGELEAERKQLGFPGDATVIMAEGIGIATRAGAGRTTNDLSFLSLQ